jgi:hypothetical protein
MQKITPELERELYESVLKRISALIGCQAGHVGGGRTRLLNNCGRVL